MRKSLFENAQPYDNNFPIPDYNISDCFAKYFYSVHGVFHREHPRWLSGKVYTLYTSVSADYDTIYLTRYNNIPILNILSITSLIVISM